MLNFTFKKKFTFVFIGMFLLLSCHSHSNKQTSSNVYTHHIVLNTPLVDTKILLHTLQNILLFTTYSDTQGKWSVPSSALGEEHMIRISTKGAKDSTHTFTKELCAYALVKDLKEKSIEVNAATTLFCQEINATMSEGQIITRSKQIPFNLPYLHTHLINADISDIFFHNVSWQEWKDRDSDGDNISNTKELQQGLNPASTDSDHDTLNDYDELTLYGTEANDSDSDHDFIPDNIEVVNGTNPTQSDENKNQILDGLEGDPFFQYQWYIYADKNESIATTSNIKTIIGNDLGILPLYHRSFGNTHDAVIVQVVDGGVEQSHEDLDVSLAHSYNSVNGTQDPTPTKGVSSNPVQIFFRGHGTAVAGIIAAKGFNGLGIRGVAPKVKIAGSNWLETEALETLTKVWLNGENANDIAISNNSWGATYLDEKSYETIMKNASETMRDGKGRIFVFSAGNDREKHVNANHSYLINNPYAIAVAAVNHTKHYASYSTPGSNILVSAYGGEHYYDAPTMMTTFSSGLSMYTEELLGRKGPITLEEDSEKNYTFSMNGTSAAAPMVSGALALVLDLCPSLTWRDVRYLIAKTAIKVDINNTEWIQNSAKLWHNNNYGFGLINASTMVEDCLSPIYKHLSIQQTIKTEKNLTLEIPDNNNTIETTLYVKDDVHIEWIGLTLAIDHPYAGDLDIVLISPSGTPSHLMEPNSLKSNLYKDGFRFSTVALMGESSKGLWHIRIRDALKDDRGKLLAIKLEIQGAKP